ncbi:LamG-like jellyroll fold domain-containing protein [Mariniflexile aquimaris]|uniref:LamG-like jellyroll fold domain-containing protein n=1 Tax=Mariniflexile aquimaris TaxID=881009 RepID=A0ABW3BQK7_9FLAO
MKKFLKYITAFFMMLAIASCNDGIDGITEVDPGADATAPVVTIKAPLNGAKFKVNDPVIAVDIEFEVTDDIEVGTITVFIDGSQIASYSGDFKDYRRVLQALTAENIATGVHELKITATDLDGKSTSATVTFEKEPPYIPLFSNEIFYMAFDNDYVELISVKPTTKVGSPLFAGTSVVGTNAYKGATDSYLTFPTAGLNLGSELSASFWYKVNTDPDRAGVLVIGPPDTANPTAQNNRTSGFRFFRENAGGKQRFKLNVGNGTADTWVDGGAAADVAAGSDWVHMAFTISATSAIVYINGVLVKESPITGVSWTGCDVLSIMSGAPRFTGWSHKSDNSFMDDLRLFNKALTLSEIQNIIAVTNPYVPAANETLYMPFDNNYINVVGNTTATKVGTPGYAGEAKKGTNAYAGATDSYLTLPTTGLTGESFSATMWYKVNATPDRAGILVAGPEDTANPTAQNNRKNGFRFFRENAGGKQRFKLNVGNGTADVWVDGGTAADVDPTLNAWVHLAFTISPTKAIVYINGLPVKESAITGIDWTGCNILSIMSGAPRFTGWSHLSDLSYLDELHLYNKTLTQAEIQSMM